MGLSSFQCIYVDHQSASVSELGRIVASLEAAIAPSDESVVTLSTCQRVEQYRYCESYLFPVSTFATLLPHTHMCSGNEVVLRRLTRIATGTESLLLGERFIFQQVQRAFSALKIETPLLVMGKLALDIAQEARLRFDFTARRDYTDITFDILANYLDQKPKALVVVGSGILGQAVVRHQLAQMYDRVFCVTRFPKKYRKKIGGLATACIHPESVSTHLGLDNYHIVLAINDAAPDYLKVLRDLVLNDRCVAAVDLSSSSVVGPERPTYYHHEYDESFSTRLKSEGAALTSSLEAVTSYIDTSVAAQASKLRFD